MIDGSSGKSIFHTMNERHERSVSEKSKRFVPAALAALFLSGCATLPNGNSRSGDAALIREALHFISDTRIPAHRTQVPFLNQTTERVATFVSPENWMYRVSTYTDQGHPTLEIDVCQTHSETDCAPFSDGYNVIDTDINEIPDSIELNHVVMPGVRVSQTFFRDNRGGEKTWNEQEARELYDRALQGVSAYVHARHAPAPRDYTPRLEDTI